MAVVLAATAMAAACSKDKLEWKEHVLTRIEVGPFAFDIPRGWRDTSESADPQLARITRRLGPDAHMIVRENASDTDTNIAFMWTEASGGRFTCEQFVAAMGMMTSSDEKIDPDSVTSEELGDDLLCSFRMSIGKAVGQLWIRLRGTYYLTLQCTHLRSGDRDADADCTQLVHALRAQ